MVRVLRRTLKRVLLRQELWSGNRERPLNLLRCKPEDNIVLWAWTKWPGYHQQAQQAQTNPQWSQATVLHLQTRAEVKAFKERFDIG